LSKIEPRVLIKKVYLFVNYEQIEQLSLKILKKLRTVQTLKKCISQLDSIDYFHQPQHMVCLIIRCV